MNHELIDHSTRTEIDKDGIAEYTLDLVIAIDDTFMRRYKAQLKGPNPEISLGMMFDLLGKK